MPDWRPFHSKYLQRPVVIADTETTGLFSKHPWAKVWDLAAVIAEPDGTIRDTFQCIVAHEGGVDRRAAESLAISGMTVEALQELMDAEGVPAKAAAERLYRWIHLHFGGGIVQKPLILAYNADFDHRGIQALGHAELNEIPWGPCVMRSAMAILGPAGALDAANPRHPRFDPKVPWLMPKQIRVAAHFDLPIHEPAHRALADAKTAAGIWHAIRQHAENEIKKEWS